MDTDILSAMENFSDGFLNKAKYRRHAQFLFTQASAEIKATEDVDSV